jgi:hypothetical protein
VQVPNVLSQTALVMHANNMLKLCSVSYANILKINMLAKS